MKYYIDNTMSINEILCKMNDFDTLYLKNGVYREKVRVTKNNITIIGEGKDTIISYKDYFTKIDSNNFEYLTVRTYSMIILGDNVTLQNLSVRNEANKATIYGQAVALEVLGDNFKAYNVNLLGDQDTLLAGPIPDDLLIRYKDILPRDELKGTSSHQLYDSCYIEGGIDFIFGSATALFKNCHLHSINNGFIAAPSHSKDIKIGFVFDNCLITSNINVGNVYLARPWRDYGYSTFINCKIEGNHINKDLFHNWVKGREETCRFFLYNTTSSKPNNKIYKDLTEEASTKIINDISSFF